MPSPSPAETSSVEFSTPIPPAIASPSPSLTSIVQFSSLATPAGPVHALSSPSLAVQLSTLDTPAAGSVFEPCSVFEPGANSTLAASR